MGENLVKLSPHRDLQCYFERPSAIAAMSGATAAGFTLSGTWRQQFDWAVVEWSRENVFEHPALRNLPDGDLSGLTLSYVETRENCIALDSTWYPTVDWPYLRIWAEQGGSEQLYKVRLRDYATPVDATQYERAWAEFDLTGTLSAGDYIELAWLDEHYTIQLFFDDTLEIGIASLCDAVNASSPTMEASAEGTRLRLTWKAEGTNGNRISVYGNVSGGGTESWEPAWQMLHGGVSPTDWRVQLSFSDLVDADGRAVPANAIRKMRWTYAADIQGAGFERSEFCVQVSEWTVTGSNRLYQVAGPGSRRVEDDDRAAVYSGSWWSGRGNFSGGSIRWSDRSGAAVAVQYTFAQPHILYVGTRRHSTAPAASILVDGALVRQEQLAVAGEDALVRLKAGEFGAGTHTVTLRHGGRDGETLYFDFLEMALPATELPTFPPDAVLTVATDWDTDHSLAVPAERTAWLIENLGFRGRQNHYMGALWFYEMCRPGHRYASATIEFIGTPEFGKSTTLLVGPTAITHVNLIGDTAESIARAFQFEINAGSTALWAEVEGAVLSLHARAMGSAGNAITFSVETQSTSFSILVSGAHLEGGIDGDWRTDLAAIPRLNRAVRDWSRAFYRSLKSYGIDTVAAFSMELQHGDPLPEAGIAQRYPGGEPALLNTPALQTNFSPTSIAYWRQVYSEMAQVMAEAGCLPYLQFGEVQWWYFPSNGGMPFYDEYTKTRFAGEYGRPMHVFAGTEVPEAFPDECAYLPALIGEFTNAVMQHVRAAHPGTRFEVLYPPDVNDTPLNRAINLPAGSWNAAALDCLKTENFTYTGNRDLNRARASVGMPMELGFPRRKSSHLIGIGDYTTPWQKEVRLSRAAGAESIVLFALDQFCLIGYPPRLERGQRRSFARHG